MRARRARVEITAAALIAVLAGCGRGQPPDAPPPPEVLVATARLGPVPDHREYVGNVRAVNRVEVRSRVRGYLLAQRFGDGQSVTEGDVLFEIDPSTYQAALGEAKGQLARANAAAAHTRRDYVRAQELFDAKIASASVLDQRRAERDGALADVEAAEAAVRTGELNLSYCTVRAPIAGRIGRALVDVGNLVGESGQDTLLAELVQVDPIHVYFAPTELERLDVEHGASTGRTGAIPIRLILGDGTLYPHEGLVDYVEPTVDPTRGTITVRALIPNPEGVLKPGAFVRVVAVFPDVPDAVLVPERAVLDQQAGQYVLVVEKDETVAQRPVRIGGTHDGMRQIRKGLAPGERVIIDGVQKARPGAKVVAKTG
ncbi:MAG: efflux RND transporter periplasmic adaptor subunit [Deltaproteobacteria bacterium]|nr:efflux RND transporter periplasmic adaptor subunit [Deltaproteobacteria bacterium]